jgi:hypothetical protein
MLSSSLSRSASGPSQWLRRCQHTTAHDSHGSSLASFNLFAITSPIMPQERAEIRHQPLKGSKRLAEVLASGLEQNEMAAEPVPRQNC